MSVINQSSPPSGQTLTQALSTNVSTLPSQTTAWQSVLQTAYNNYTPNLADFAQAIYSVWLNPTTIANSITYSQLANGLLAIVDNNNNPVFTANTVYPAVNVYYMMVTLIFDTASILANNPNPPPSPTLTWLNSSITMSDNHPGTDTYSGGIQFELDDQGLTPNMTICWTPTAEISTVVVTLTEFFQPSGSAQNWSTLAGTPVAVGGQSWISIANASLPAQTTATYSFQLTIAGSNGLFAFDPYIGDDDE